MNDRGIKLGGGKRHTKHDATFHNQQLDPHLINDQCGAFALLPPQHLLVVAAAAAVVACWCLVKVQTVC